MTTQTDAARIARRYPPKKTPPWAWVALAVTVAVVGGAWLLWTALYGANPAVSGRIAAFDITSDTNANATITVQRPDPSVEVVCTIVAKAVSYETVGQLPLEVAASDQELQNIDVSLRTFKRATTVDLEGCVVKR